MSKILKNQKKLKAITIVCQYTRFAFRFGVFANHRSIILPKWLRSVLMSCGARGEAPRSSLRGASRRAFPTKSNYDGYFFDGAGVEVTLWISLRHLSGLPDVPSNCFGCLGLRSAFLCPIASRNAGVIILRTMDVCHRKRTEFQKPLTYSRGAGVDDIHLAGGRYVPLIFTYSGRGMPDCFGPVRFVKSPLRATLLGFTVAWSIQDSNLNALFRSARVWIE